MPIGASFPARVHSPNVSAAGAGAVAAIGVSAVALANGGYFPTSWGWAAIGFVVVITSAALVRGRLEVPILGVALVAGLLAFAGFVALSTAWAESAAQPVLEVERLLALAAGVAALLVVGGGAAGVAAGLVAATVLVATVALPGEAGERLAGPMGYANALGALCALGALLATGLAAHAWSRIGRVVAGGAAPLLAATLVLTGSRGALGALAVATVVAFALDPRRLRLLAIGVVLSPAVALALLLRFHVGGIVVAVVVGAGLVAAAERLPISLPAVAERRIVIAVTCAGVVLGVVGLIAVGGPSGIVDRFNAPLPGAGSSRVFSLSSDNRADYWRVAWREASAHPVLGGGIGSWERRWNLERPSAFPTRNAHNLYLETLAELGVVGFAVLLVALAVPFAALGRARCAPLGGVVAAGYVLFLVHCGVDWDWQITAVALAGTACGAAVVLADPTRLVRLPVAPVVVAAFVVGAVAAAGQISNSALARSEDATARGDTAEGARLARRARFWAPWSYQPWQRLGEAQLASGDVAAARRSFQQALARDRENWELWLDLATATDGRARSLALGRARQLNPLAPENRSLG
jgi:O-antigen ligase